VNSAYISIHEAPEASASSGGTETLAKRPDHAREDTYTDDANEKDDSGLNADEDGPSDDPFLAERREAFQSWMPWTRRAMPSTPQVRRYEHNSYTASFDGSGCAFW
jgi:hypothetical protein